MFLVQNDYDLLKECGFLKNDINSLIKDFKNVLIEQNEDYLELVKNEEESILEKTLKN